MIMNEAVQIKSYPPPAFDVKEAARYLGDKKPTAETYSLIEKYWSIAEKSFTYKVAYRIFSVKTGEDFVNFPFAVVHSKNLAKCLEGCTRALIFGATVGIGADRLISRYANTLPSGALTVDAIATERIESLCDTFCNELEEGGLNLTPRFSPGYGDLGLEHQRVIFDVLDLPRKIGITLNESLIMSPSKSVTAIIGIKSVSD